MTGQRPAQNSHGPAVDLFGDALAAVAQELARHLDPERKGLHISLIQQAVEQRAAHRSVAMPGSRLDRRSTKPSTGSFASAHYSVC